MVGIFSIFGPVAAACLAKGIGTASALSLILLLLGIGIGLPSIAATLPILTISTLLFGSQPGLSVLLATRVRDLGEPVLLPELMRVMILANGAGAAVGGLALPKLLEITGSYEIVFFTGAMAFLLAAVASVSHGVKKFVNPK